MTEGFDEIVVGPDIETRDAILDRGPIGNQEHWHWHPARPQRPYDVEPVAVRQPEVDDEQVISDVVERLRNAFALATMSSEYPASRRVSPSRSLSRVLSSSRRRAHWLRKR